MLKLVKLTYNKNGGLNIKINKKFKKYVWFNKKRDWFSMQYRNGIIGLIIKISKKQFKVILIITIITVLISALSTKILIN